MKNILKVNYIELLFLIPLLDGVSSSQICSVKYFQIAHKYFIHCLKERV